MLVGETATVSNAHDRDSAGTLLGGNGSIPMGYVRPLRGALIVQFISRSPRTDVGSSLFDARDSGAQIWACKGQPPKGEVRSFLLATNERRGKNAIVTQRRMNCKEHECQAER